MAAAPPSSTPWLAHVRWPCFYGWILVAVAFITTGVSVNARTAFSLLFPPLLVEFGWERGITAGAFFCGVLVGPGLGPLFWCPLGRPGAPGGRALGGCRLGGR